METLSSVNIPRREDDTHKGDYGRILLIGGNANLGGAIMLAARACVYSRQWANNSSYTPNEPCCTTFSLS